MEADPQDIAQWLARETGHTDVPEEGYDAQNGALPQEKHKNLRKFFDGLNIEKAMTTKRRANAVEDIDQADELMKAIRPAIESEAPTSNPGGY